MRKAESDSWRVSIGDGQTTHAVLFVRDACRLTPADDPIVPTHLVGDVPDLSSRLTKGDRTQASSAWLDWWRRVIEFEGAKELGEFTQRTAQSDAVRRLAPSHREVFDPPDFESLATWPSLQSMSRTICEQALLA
jgi:hypothetical protein